MLDKETFVPIQFFKKEAYTGSMNGMRYRIKKEEEGLEAAVYPQPFCYEATPDEKKIKAVFPFSVEGREQAINWINEQYVEKQDLWAVADRK
ncbi:GNAT family acetyltransferase [Clostridium boliviensis]|uniref:GNAT family acetyltransferase n=1 Tax=Clostridium boliviensis TaxID=318465 RepID=A0ABU4GEM8_9CLOT|nr:GNAT family acetyltransferase [Clostridium boliviensis]MDW2796021.1 GNAT family acetyltransferase [Clostridium boliviensis]